MACNENHLSEPAKFWTFTESYKWLKNYRLESKQFHFLENMSSNHKKILYIDIWLHCHLGFSWALLHICPAWNLSLVWLNKHFINAFFKEITTRLLILSLNQLPALKEVFFNSSSIPIFVFKNSPSLNNCVKIDSSDAPRFLTVSINEIFHVDQLPMKIFINI